MTDAGSTARGAGVRAALATLRDVAGINGSFVFSDDGRLLAREIHAMFDDMALAEASQRLARLRETFAAVGDELDLAVIRFQDHKLYLKVLASGTLCILADGAVNMPALRMAANVVGRRIAADLGVLGDAPSPGAAAEAAMVEGAEPSLSGAARVRPAPPGMRRFRGRTVE